jgi:hypothetical protein
MGSCTAQETQSVRVGAGWLRSPNGPAWHRPTGLSGPLRIGAFPTAVRTLLPAALVALGREHPGLELMVSGMDPAVVPDAVRDRRLVSAGGAGAQGDGLEEDPADGRGVRGDEHPAAGDLGDGLHFCLGDCGADAQDDDLDRLVRVSDLL